MSGTITMTGEEYDALRAELDNCQRAWGFQRSEIDALLREKERLAEQFACMQNNRDHYRKEADQLRAELERMKAAPSRLRTEQILSLERRSGMTDDEALRFARSVESAIMRQPVAGEREAFEAWHMRKFATKWDTGQPTRDKHNGVYVDEYGPKQQQLAWEAWQARAALSAPAAGQDVASRYMETFVKLADYLGIDPLEAKKAPGKPSGVFIAAIERRVGQDVSALVEAVKELMFPDVYDVSCQEGLVIRCGCRGCKTKRAVKALAAHKAGGGE